MIASVNLSIALHICWNILIIFLILCYPNLDNSFPCTSPCIGRERNIVLFETFLPAQMAKMLGKGGVTVMEKLIISGLGSPHLLFILRGALHASAN